MAEEKEEQIDFSKFSEKLKKYPNRFIAVCLLLIALSGMWFCYKVAYVRGSLDMCENSNGNPILIDTNDIKEAKCLIQYDFLSKYDNNLGLDPDKVKEFEELIENAAKR